MDILNAPLLPNDRFLNLAVADYLAYMLPV